MKRFIKKCSVYHITQQREGAHCKVKEILHYRTWEEFSQSIETHIFPLNNGEKMISTEKLILRKIRGYWKASEYNFIYNGVSVIFHLVMEVRQGRKYNQYWQRYHRNYANVYQKYLKYIFI